MERKLDKKYIWATSLPRAIGLIGGYLIAIIVFAVPAIGATGDETVDMLSMAGVIAVFGFFITIFSIGMGILGAYLSYKFYTYQIKDDVFTRTYGVITRRTTDVPYSRIQNVDVVEPFFFRLFGLAQVNIQTAGATSASASLAEASLPGVSKADANMIRDDILKHVHRQDGRSTNHGL